MAAVVEATAISISPITAAAGTTESQSVYADDIDNNSSEAGFVLSARTDMDTVSQGDEVTVSISLDKNPGIVGFMISVGYDDTVLSIDDVSKIEDCGLFGTDFHFTEPYLENPFVLLWSSVSVDYNHEETGDIADITFKVKDDAKIGKANNIVDISVAEVIYLDGTFTLGSYPIEETFADTSAAAINVICKTHDFTEWKEEKAVDCENDGIQKRTCKVCGFEDTMIIDALGHSFGEWSVKSQPTIDEPGIKTNTCTVCGKTINKRYYLPIPRAGITFQMYDNFVFRDTIAQQNTAVYDSNYFDETGEVGPYPEIEKDIYNLDGTFNDVYVDGNGSYSISIDGHALANMSGILSGSYNLIRLSTNIDSYLYPDIKITIDKFTIGGKEIELYYNVFSYDNGNLTTDMQKDVFNTDEIEFTRNDVVLEMLNTWNNFSNFDTSDVIVDGNITIDFTVEGMYDKSDVLIGDVNKSGDVDLVDEITLARWLAGWNVEIDESAADVDGSGAIDLLDDITLARRLAGWNV